MIEGTVAESGSGCMSLPNPDPDLQHCSKLLLFIVIFRNQMPQTKCIHVQVKSEVGRRGGIPLVMAAIRSSFILPCFDIVVRLVSLVLFLPSCLFC
jgi:hypothetical protein